MTLDDEAQLIERKQFKGMQHLHSFGTTIGVLKDFATNNN